MSQQYMYFICEDQDKEASKTLVQKLSEQAGPGAIVLLTAEEHELMSDMHIVPIGPPIDYVKLCNHGIPMSSPCAKCSRFGGKAS